jgi:hypothetical protein
MERDDPPSDLRQSTRRRILSISAGGLAAGIAGCAGRESDSPESTPTDTQPSTNASESAESSSPTHEFKSPPYETIETEESGSSNTIAGEIVLEEGQYAQHEFQLEATTRIQITGVNEEEGTKDLFLLSPERELEKYRAGERAVFSGGVAETDIESLERSVEVSPGPYFLVFDNTAVYGAEPQGTARFEFQLVLGSDAAAETASEQEQEDSEDEETPTETSPSQPKIREVQDNFGHTFEFSGDTGGAVRVDDEIVVSDETAVELCVTDVAKQDDNSITYSYDFLDDASHPDNPERATTRIEENCWRWAMRRTDYQSRWGFRIWIRNEDEIYYQNNSVESDYRVDVYYTNLRLDE